MRAEQWSFSLSPSRPASDRGGRYDLAGGVAPGEADIARRTLAAQGAPDADVGPTDA